MHYDDPNQDLRDLYFISPSWLCDLMAKVVTVKEAHNFVRDGVLFERNIPFIIDGNQFPKEFYPKYLRLLARFQIACRIDKERILVPSQLPLTSPLEVGMSHAPPHTLSRIHSFSCIPNGFWSRFISRFLLYLGEMLNVSQESAEQNWTDETFEEDHINESDISGENGAEAREESEEGYASKGESGETEEAEIKNSDETENSMSQNADPSVDGIKSANGFTENEENKFENKIDNGINNSDQLEEPTAKQDSKVKGEHFANAEKSVRYSHVSSPPFVLNDCLFHNEDVSRYDAQSPRNYNPESRDVTPVSIGGDSSVSSQVSTSSHDHSRAASSNAFDYHDHLSPRPTSSSSASEIEDGPSIPWRLINETSDRHPESMQNGIPRADSEEKFDEPMDIPSLLARRYLICWRNGVLFNHPLLYLSVSLLPSEDDRELVETKVSRSLMGYRALAFTVDHIRTLIKEWFPGLEGTDGFTPYVRQFVPCPICLDSGINPAYRFDVTECLKESLTKDFVVCANTHTPQVVRLSELCPDLLFMDLDASLQLNATNLRYDETESSLLGSGQFGKVYRGMYEEKAAAIKVYNFKLEENPDLREALDNFYEVRQEAVVLSRISRHPNVISFFGVAARPKFCLVIELATQGTLRDVLRTRDIERILIYRIAQQVASAVAHLHLRGIIHRDLKSDNVLMFSLDGSSDINVKLADFGTANFISPVGLKFFTGTPGFIAPEIFEYSKTEEYNEMVDVYSYAMVLYELISKRRPFHIAQSALDINAAIKEGKRPIFYDLPDTRVRLFTLTVLMLKCWTQEAMKRPTSHEISRQMKSPSFCLLYGKVPLVNVNTPRQLCFIQGTNEIWMSCDDRAGASVLVVDLKTSTVQQKFIPENKSLMKAKESFFNISAIYDIDKQHAAIVLRSTSDYVSIYSTERKKLLDSYQVADNYIRSLAVSENHVILGCEDGSFTVLSKKDFVKGRFKDKISVVVNKRRAISAVATCKTTGLGNDDGQTIVLGCDKYIYRYPLGWPDSVKVNPETRSASEKKIICEMHVSENGQILFVSHNGSPVLSIFMIDSMDLFGQIDCSIEIKRLIPNSDVYDQRITTFCVSGDTLWIGTGSGHILIYEIKNDSTPCLITWLKPYKLEVRSVMACHIPNMDPSRFVVSIGKEINIAALCYGENGLCLLTDLLPVDPDDPNVQRKNSRGAVAKYNTLPKKTTEFEKKMMLIWDAPEAAVLKKVVE